MGAASASGQEFLDLGGHLQALRPWHSPELDRGLRRIGGHQVTAGYIVFRKAIRSCLAPSLSPGSSENRSVPK